MLLWVVALKCSNTDLLDILESAKADLAAGRLSCGQAALSSLYSQLPDSLAIKKAYFEYRISIGEYLEVIHALKNDKQLANVFNTATKALELSKNMQINIEKLAVISPYSKTIQRNYVEYLIVHKDFDKAAKVVSRIKIFFSTDTIYFSLQGYLDLASGHIQSGISYLKEAGALRLSKDLQSCYNKYLELSMERTTKQIIINKYEEAVKVFSNLQKAAMYFREKELANVVLEPLTISVLRIIVEYGLNFKRKDVMQYADHLYKISKDEDDKAKYIKALILSKEFEKAEKELASQRFTNQKLYNDLFNQIKKHKEARKQEEANKQYSNQGYGQYFGNQDRYSYTYGNQGHYKQTQNKNQYQQNTNSTQTSEAKDPEDPKGYYKTLEMSKTDNPKLIKSAYNKLAKKYNPDRYKDKDNAKYEELTKKMMQINFAKDFLMDDQNRNDYNSGLFEKQIPQQNYQQQDFYIEDLGSIFENLFSHGGFFTTGGSGGQRGYTRYTTRTFL